MSYSRFQRAANGTRTRDLDLGKVALYQLSYCRVSCFHKCISLNAVAKVQLFFEPAIVFIRKFLYLTLVNDYFFRTVDR